nr:hypothetical protein [Klebsiella pneumoniae]
MNSNNLQSAVETVREKINKIEDLIKTINPQIHSTPVKWGVFYHARRICSQREVEHHMGKNIVNCTNPTMSSILATIYSWTDDGKLTSVVNDGKTTLRYISSRRRKARHAKHVEPFPSLLPISPYGGAWPLFHYK